MSDKKSNIDKLLAAKRDWLKSLNKPDTRPLVKCKTCGIKYKRKGDTRFFQNYAIFIMRLYLVESTLLQKHH